MRRLILVMWTLVTLAAASSAFFGGVALATNQECKCIAGYKQVNKPKQKPRVVPTGKYWSCKSCPDYPSTCKTCPTCAGKVKPCNCALYRCHTSFGCKGGMCDKGSLCHTCGGEFIKGCTDTGRYHCHCSPDTSAPCYPKGADSYNCKLPPWEETMHPCTISCRFCGKVSDVVGGLRPPCVNSTCPPDP